METRPKESKATVDKGQYFQEMKETWKHTSEYMQQKLSQIETKDREAILALRENYVVKKRISDKNPKVRPFLMRLSFEVCGGGDWKRIIPACAAVEFLNISTYVTNAVFDEKGESKTKKDVNQYIIDAMLLRDLATECLLEVKVSLSPEETRAIVGKLAEINKLVYLGQYVDLYQLKKENLKRFKSFEEMKQLYEKRTEYFCGYFMSNIAYIGAILANATGEQIKALKNFGLSYGAGIQIANDLGDFVFGKAKDYEKTYKDQYSDIKQGKLTYPIILGLETEEKNNFKKLLGKKNASKRELVALTKYNGIYGKVKQILRIPKKLCKIIESKCCELSFSH